MVDRNLVLNTKYLGILRLPLKKAEVNHCFMCEIFYSLILECFLSICFRLSRRLNDEEVYKSQWINVFIYD